VELYLDYGKKPFCSQEQSGFSGLLSPLWGNGGWSFCIFRFLLFLGVVKQGTTEKVQEKLVIIMQYIDCQYHAIDATNWKYLGALATVLENESMQIDFFSTAGDPSTNRHLCSLQPLK
jgi:hypothetical protein